MKTMIDGLYLDIYFSVKNELDSNMHDIIFEVSIRENPGEEPTTFFYQYLTSKLPIVNMSMGSLEGNGLLIDEQYKTAARNALTDYKLEKMGL